MEMVHQVRLSLGSESRGTKGLSRLQNKITEEEMKPIPYAEFYNQLLGAMSLGGQDWRPTLLEQWILSIYAFCDEGAIYLPLEDRNKLNSGERWLHS